MMIKVPLMCLFTLSFSIAFSQTIACSNELDTAAVISIAKRKNAYWTQNHQYIPGIQFDGKHCEWIVESFKSTYTNKGECRNTNGCTKVLSVRLVIDATNGKVKTRTKEQKLYYNYE